jgi:enoyl-CoA hydratase/carnithine racemase
MSHETAADLPALFRDGDVYIVRLGDGENRFNPERNRALVDALTEVAAAPRPRALVTMAEGKFWSNGLDLDWMGAHQDQAQEALDQFHSLLAAFLEVGVPTVAAVQGHAFAAGAMLASAHDLTVMRADRGFWCVPEADLGMVFTPGMAALLQARLPHRTAHVAMTTARRYGGNEALVAGIVDEVVGESEVLATAVLRAQELATKDPATLAGIKRRMYGPVLTALRAPQTL